MGRTVSALLSAFFQVVKQVKKVLSFIVICALLFALNGCSTKTGQSNTQELSVVATMFAEYDFARQVIGDCGTVKMLMPPGADMHSYEPTPQDIISIRNADIFIYGGGESDTWLDTVLESVNSQSLHIISMTEICELYEEETVDGMESDHVHDESCEHEEEHHHSEYDEHVWTSPVNAIKIIEEITQTLCSLDEKNSSVYKQNSEKYIKEIELLDKQFRDTVENAERRLMVFADRFPFRYFVEEYSLDYSAAFPGCSHDTEPSAKTIQYLIKKIRDDGIPVIFTIESSDRRVAEAISNETEAKILEFHSCHTVTKSELENGVTYVELMKRNLTNLKEALN